MRGCCSAWAAWCPSGPAPAGSRAQLQFLRCASAYVETLHKCEGGNPSALRNIVENAGALA